MLFFILTAILYGVEPRTERYPARTRVRVNTRQGVRIVSPRCVIEFLVRLDYLLFGLSRTLGVARGLRSDREPCLERKRNTIGPRVWLGPTHTPPLTRIRIQALSLRTTVRLMLSSGQVRFTVSTVG